MGGPSDRPQGLGRGLAALIPQRAPQAAGSIEIGLDRISANPRQPRTRIDPAALATLAASIREHGVIQPILVTETIDGYQLVAGERRVQAARLAGMTRIPAVVRQLADREQLELALDHRRDDPFLDLGRQSPDRPPVTLGDDAIGNRDLDRRMELEESQGVGDGRPGPSDALGEAILGESEVVDELLVGAGGFEWVEILAL